MNRSCLHHVIFLKALLRSYELNTLDACWIAVDVWSNSSWCRKESVYLLWTWCLYRWSCLDNLITMHFSINCSTVICLPTICFVSRQKPLVKTMAPGSIFYHIIFQIYKIKITKIPCCNLFTFILFHTFTYLLYLSLSDLILASNREGMENPFIVLGPSIFLFV